MNKITTFDNIVVAEDIVVAVDMSFRKKCQDAYPNHKNGCPNYDKKVYCPPQAPGIGQVLQLNKPIHLVMNCFDLGAHAKRMKEQHPQWTERQTRNLLYWQREARAKLKVGCRWLLKNHPEVVILLVPEACGVFVSKTVFDATGIKLDWPPKNYVYQVALAGTPRKTLSPKHPEFYASLIPK